MICRYGGEKGYGFTFTMAMNKEAFFGDVPFELFHKPKKPKSHLLPVKCFRMENPIFAVQEFPAKDGKKAYTLQHSSFMSTTSTNIVHVNGVNGNKIYVIVKKRGQGVHKKGRVVELNESRVTYLTTYGAVDGIDHLIQECCMFLKSRKYWHSAMVHIFAMAVITAYDMYLEVCEGKLNKNWHIKRPASFKEFRAQLATQMLYYSAKNGFYKGDKRMRCNTQLPKRRRTKKRDMNDSVTQEQFEEAKQGPRLCGDLTEYHRHVQSYSAHKHGHKCVVCKQKAYTFCQVCGEWMHRYTNRGGNGQKYCDINWHNDLFFGLAEKDHCSLKNKPKSTFKEPLPTEIADNAATIKGFKSAETD